MQIEATNDSRQVNEGTDNSQDLDIQEPSNIDDNSYNDIENQEPETKTDDGSEQQEGKFKTLEEATKGYNELEKKLGIQSNELGDLRKKAELAEKLQKQIDEQKLQEAQSKGFETVEEFETNKEVVNFVANEYAKHLSECEFPEEMVKLLAEYKKNPSRDYLETIEAEFSTDTLKNVAGKTELFKGQLQTRQNEALEEEIKQSAIKYLDENVNKYAEEFKNPEFAALDGEAFRAYGCDLDTEKFVNLMKAYGESCVKAAGIKNGIKKENSQATDEMAGLTDFRNQNQYTNNILDLEGQDLNSAIKNLV